MSKIKRHFNYLPDGSLDLAAWLNDIQNKYELNNIALLKKAALFTEKNSNTATLIAGPSFLEYGLEIAEILLALQIDVETAAAAIICATSNLNPEDEEKIQKAFELDSPHDTPKLDCLITKSIPLKNKLVNHSAAINILKLAQGFKKMALIDSLSQSSTAFSHFDKIRKMLLAMATDIRVIIIKLAERLAFMRSIKSCMQEEKKSYAQIILNIYTPLANRLGIGQLKWELEDIAFHYLNPIAYKTIATFLMERRIDREKNIKELIHFLQHKLTQATITAQVTGRAKHIYSIYLKAQRKDVHFSEIYDASALRILVPSIENCYAALSVVHQLWPPIFTEFDDYIAHPKPNGYRSIHTAVIDEQGKHFEIQIRTFEMHEEAEKGVAAHWMYKEHKTILSDHAKINLLRQLLDWHKEIAPSESLPPENLALDQLIYVITPRGEIVDLPQKATPLDFAYFIHSGLGHRCRGAKVNGQIVPLNYQLKTGEKVDIITAVQGQPSRDWLNPELGYIQTTRAREKITHWFKQQTMQQDIEEGKQIVERELIRQGITKMEALSVLAKQYGFKSEANLLIGLARGNIRVGQLIQALRPKEEASTQTFSTEIKLATKNYGAAILGSADLLTHLAKCCKPIPGDQILGYITRGKGLSIHKKNCSNVKKLLNEKLIAVQWNEQYQDQYTTDLKIIALNKEKFLHDLTALFNNEKVTLMRLESTLNENQHKILVIVTIRIQDSKHLQRLLMRIQQLPSVMEIQRI